MKASIATLGIGLIILASGCATVDVTKTAKGFHEPTRADDVEILMTRVDRPYDELATVSTSNWKPNETAKMHNAIRSKTAALGADAVIITGSGQVRDGGYKMWTTGVAIKYK